MFKPTLGYWNIRGLGESIRFILHYRKVDFEEKLYVCGANEWANEKNNLGLDFPNLPYYIEGDVKITQTMTIMRYLAQKHGLDGKDNKQKLRVSLAEQQIVDLRTALINLCYSDNYELMKGKFIKKIPNHMQQWKQFLGDNPYLSGDNITYPDFIAYETFDWYRLFHKDALVACPNLMDYQNRMKNLPELQDYWSSPRYKIWPLFGMIAKFGYAGKPPDHA